MRSSRTHRSQEKREKNQKITRPQPPPPCTPPLSLPFPSSSATDFISRIFSFSFFFLFFLFSFSLLSFAADERVYGFVRFETGDEMSKRAKFALITWVGASVGALKKAKVSTDKAFVKEVIVVSVCPSLFFFLFLFLDEVFFHPELCQGDSGRQPRRGGVRARQGSADCRGRRQLRHRRPRQVETGWGERC